MCPPEAGGCAAINENGNDMFDECVGKTVKVVYDDGDRIGEVLRGELVSVDSAFIKVRTHTNFKFIAIPKISKLEVNNDN